MMLLVWYGYDVPGNVHDVDPSRTAVPFWTQIPQIQVDYPRNGAAVLKGLIDQIQM